jgi:hypothetical protein
MSIEYSIILDTSESPAALVKMLAENLGMQAKSDIPNTLFGGGIVCAVLPQSELGRKIVEEKFGIKSSVDIICKLNKFDLYNVGMNYLIQMCMLVISRHTYNMLMLSNGERGLLLRKNGKITVDSRDQYWKIRWTSEFLNFGIPLVEEPLPSL